MVIIPLLSFTWLFGLLTPLHKVFRYVFCPMISLMKVPIPSVQRLIDGQTFPVCIYIKIDLESLSFFLKGFLIFALHCAPTGRLVFYEKKNLCRVRI